MRRQRWVFVRHGESVANVERWLSGHVDVPLTEAGRAQAHALRAILAEERLAHAVSSDLCRAVETARHALGDAGPALETTPRLRERSVGAWAQVPIDELPPQELASVLGTWHGRPPGGESLREVAVRAAGYLAELTPAGTVLVVAHGGVLRALLGLADGWPEERIPSRHVDNAVAIGRDLPADHWSRVVDRLHR